MQVRRLGPNDVEAMRNATRLFAEAFEDHDTYLRASPDHAYLTQWLATDNVLSLVAEANGATIGALVAYVLPKFEQARSEIYIYDLAVAAGHRRQGIATALIHEVQAIALEIGAWVVYVQADKDDPPAIALYEKLGAREDVLQFDIPPAPRN